MGDRWSLAAEISALCWVGPMQKRISGEHVHTRSEAVQLRCTANQGCSASSWYIALPSPNGQNVVTFSSNYALRSPGPGGVSLCLSEHLHLHVVEQGRRHPRPVPVRASWGRSMEQ